MSASFRNSSIPWCLSPEYKIYFLDLFAELPKRYALGTEVFRRAFNFSQCCWSDSSKIHLGSIPYHGLQVLCSTSGLIWLDPGPCTLVSLRASLILNCHHLRLKELERT